MAIPFQVMKYFVVGLVPYNLLCVQAGVVLSELQMLSVLDTRSVVTLVAATLSLLATAFLLRRLRAGREEAS